MLTNDINQEVGSYLGRQADAMLSKQLSISEAVYTPRTGTLNKALAGKPYDVNGMNIEVRLPKHIRFLDMKRHSKGGKPKSKYAPIYNKYVYGYLKSAIRNKLKRVIPARLIAEWKQTTSIVFDK